MKYRKLRIAWSLAWGVVAVLLCVLWVRSYWHNDQIWYRTSSAKTGIISFGGRIFLAVPGARFGKKPDNEPSLEMRHHIITQQALNEEPIWLGSRRLPVGLTNYIVPDGLLILISCAFAAIPWFRWSKRFSLRTLLIATTLVAVALGLIVWAVRS